MTQNLALWEGRAHAPLACIADDSMTAKPCVSQLCGHGKTWHKTSSLGRRGKCTIGGCPCRLYRGAEIEYRAWIENLERLRATGKRRGWEGQPSSSLLPLLNELPDKAVMIDLGCGDSGDRTIAEQLGLVAYGVDLFPPFQSHLCDGFIQGDALNLPFQSQSIDGVVLHAVTSLIKPEDRPTAYTEIARVLKPSGLFSTRLYVFTDGYPVSAREEDGRITANGFRKIKSGRLYRRRGV
jgi:SAM-dependent methyltransferase